MLINNACEVTAKREQERVSGLRHILRINHLYRGVVLIY